MSGKSLLALVALTLLAVLEMFAGPAAYKPEGAGVGGPHAPARQQRAGQRLGRPTAVAILHHRAQKKTPPGFAPSEDCDRSKLTNGGRRPAIVTSAPCCRSPCSRRTSSRRLPRAGSRLTDRASSDQDREPADHVGGTKAAARHPLTDAAPFGKPNRQVSSRDDAPVWRRKPRPGPSPVRFLLRNAAERLAFPSRSGRMPRHLDWLAGRAGFEPS